MNALTLLTTGFEAWLEERTGPSRGSTVTQGLRLDVFTTSMRDTKPISADLHQLADGAQVPAASDVTQRITDLIPTALVERTKPGECRLTEFGTRVLADWTVLGVDNDQPIAELARQVVLVDRGIAAREEVYVDAYRCWSQMLSLGAAIDWFNDPLALYMVSYLNADEDGFNPWKTIVANQAVLVGIDAADWDAWADATPKPSGWQKSHGRKLLDAAQSLAARFVGRVTFCMALEAHRLASSGVDVATAIADWEVPHA